MLYYTRTQSDIKDAARAKTYFVTGMIGGLKFENDKANTFKVHRAFCNDIKTFTKTFCNVQDAIDFIDEKEENRLKQDEPTPKDNETDLKITKTNRGFKLTSFVEANGFGCSLQESSARSLEGLIWLGFDEIGLQRFTPNQGWENVELEQNPPHGVCHVANSRMHLTQTQVAKLLPLLTHFEKHGSLPE